MRNIIIKISSILSLLLALGACQRSMLGDQTGLLNVNLQQDSSEEIIFKSETPAEDGQVFHLDFFRKGEYVASATYTVGQKSEPIELPVGPYVVKAATGANAEAAFNEPYYTGEAQVNIIEGTEHTVEITCYLSNVKVTVDFSQEIKDSFQSYQVLVTNSRRGSLSFDGETLDEAGYFKVEDNETLTWSLSMVNNNGVTYTATDTYVDVKAREHYNLSFSLGEARPELGGMYLTIKVDNSTEVKDYPARVDFGGNAAPEIIINPEFESLLSKNPVTVPYGVEESKVLTLMASKGVKSAVIKHSDMKLYAEGLPYFTELVGASATQLSALSHIGVNVTAQNYGSTSPVTVDVTKFIAGLDMDNSYKFDVSVYDVYNHMSSVELDFTVVVDADADMVRVAPWAKFAVAYGKWFLDQKPEGLTFLYKKASDDQWISVPSSAITFDEAGKTFSADITGLEPSAQYLIKAVSATDTETREMSFSTLAAPQLYNMNFDDWYQDGKVWYPFAKGGSHIWDSANEGAATFIGSSTTPVEGADAVSGKAARLESKYAVIAFAAGNLYTGDFGSINGVGATLDWGTPFSGRPVALRGYYKYTPKAINRTKAPYDNLKGQSDKCRILVILADWDAPFPINTTSGQFVDVENDPGIIGMVQLDSDEVVTSYREFCLPIEYRDTNPARIPKYAIVVCCASYLGDYFTGGEGSVMHADEFSFEYDITTLTPEEQAKVNYR